MIENLCFHQDRTCLNCHYEVVEKLKSVSETCTECFAKDTVALRYPNWKKVENNGKTE